jgi:hypothetical protein
MTYFECMLIFVASIIHKLNLEPIAKQRYNKRVIAGVKSFLALDER